MNAVSNHIKLIVFDLDGTLLRIHFEHFYSEIERVFPLLGVKSPPREETIKLVKTHKLFSLFPEEEIEQVKRSFGQLSVMPEPMLIEGATQTLEHISERGITTAIATARQDNPDKIRDELEKLGIASHFKIISSFHGQGWRNKKPQLEMIADTLNIPVEKAMMVGDSIDDITSGHAANFSHSVAVLSGALVHQDFEEHNPHAILDDITHIPQFLGK